MKTVRLAETPAKLSDSMMPNPVPSSVFLQIFPLTMLITSTKVPVVSSPISYKIYPNRYLYFTSAGTVWENQSLIERVKSRWHKPI